MGGYLVVQIKNDTDQFLVLFSSKRTKWWIIHGVKRRRDQCVDTRLTCLKEFPRCLYTYNHRKPLIFILRKSFFRNFRPHQLNTFCRFFVRDFVFDSAKKQMRTELFSRVIKYSRLINEKKYTFFKRHFVKFNYLFSRKKR